MATMPTRTAQPVRLPNPTAEGFVQALKVVRFFTVISFWVVLAVILVQLAVFVVVEWTDMFDPTGGVPPPNAAVGAMDPDPGDPGTSALPPETEASLDEARGLVEERSAMYISALKPFRTMGMIASVLLWVSLFLFLQIALLGRLSGIRQLTLSVFLLMLFLASALPWNALFEGIGAGAFFRLKHLLVAHAQRLNGTGYTTIWYYLRFLLTTLLALVLLLSSWINFSRGYEESVLLNE